ncbi:MAG: hypothetical protein JSS49_21385 [Planctomycetes bacterium]|nr:hypothetical protein [Planctomycetota bacterium]
MNCRSIATMLLTSFAIQKALIAATITVSVAGVVVDQQNTRLGDIHVELHGGDKLASDPTRGNGVYILTKGGIDDQTDRLLIVAKSKEYDDLAIEVDLEDVAGGIRRSKAPDLVLSSKNASKANLHAAEKRFTNALRTEELKVSYNLTSKEEARKSVLLKAAEVAATLPETGMSNWSGFVGRAFDEAKLKAPVLDRNELLMLPHDNTFKERVAKERDRVDSERSSLGGALGGTAALDKHKLDYLLSIPPANIPDVWLTIPEMKKHLPTINQEYRASGKIDFNWNGTDEIKPWLEGSNLKKQVLLLEQIKKGSLVTDDQKKRVDDRIHQLVPNIGHPQ